MKNVAAASMMLLLVLACHTDRIVGQDGDVTIQGTLRVLVVEGTPHERGVQHGTLLKEVIQQLIDVWKDDLERTYQMDPDSFVSQFIQETDFLSAIRQHTPDLLEELQGMAEGADIDFNTLYAYQLVDEIWVLGQEITVQKCTSFGVNRTENYPTLTAQNLDIPFFHGYQTLLHSKDPDNNMESFAFTFPGYIGANGMNSKRVSVVVNAMMQLKPSRSGLPVAFVVRGVLEKNSYQEAVQFLEEVTFGAPQNYLVGGIQQMGSYECSENRVAEFIPFEGAYFTYHTNHPLVNDNYTDGFLNYLDAEGMTLEAYQGRCLRFNSLQAHYPDNNAAFDADTMKSIFSRRDWGINNRNTFGCTIMVLSDPPELLVSPGRPDEQPFLRFTF